jgi:hypothetical protein
MREFFVVAQACEFTGNPVAGTMQVFTDRQTAVQAMFRMEDEDPGQGATTWSSSHTGGFSVTAFMVDGEVESFA